MWAWTVCVLCLSFISYCLFAFVGTEPCLSLFVYSSLLCLSFSLTVIPLPLHFPICLFPCLSLYRTPTRTHTHTHTRTHTHFCFSWYFSVISSNTTLSSCLITKQGHCICLHELPSLCGCVCVCVCVWECVACGHSHKHRRTHSLIHALWTLRSTISLPNSLPLIFPQSPLSASLLFLLVFLSFISPISNLFWLQASLSLFFFFIYFFLVSPFFSL